jgi:hypothetical protein
MRWLAAIGLLILVSCGTVPDGATGSKTFIFTFFSNVRTDAQPGSVTAPDRPVLLAQPAAKGRLSP